MSLDVYLSISHLFFMVAVLVTNKPETSGQPPSQARQHPRALARCDASSTRLKLRKNPTTTHETRPCTRRITLRLIDSLYARAPTASLRLIDLAYARAHWSKLFLNLQQKLSELRHQGTRFQLHNSSAGQARICPSNSTSAGQARICPSSTQEGQARICPRNALTSAGQACSSPSSSRRPHQQRRPRQE